MQLTVQHTGSHTAIGYSDAHGLLAAEATSSSSLVCSSNGHMGAQLTEWFRAMLSGAAASSSGAVQQRLAWRVPALSAARTAAGESMYEVAPRQRWSVARLSGCNGNIANNSSSSNSSSGLRMLPGAMQAPPAAAAAAAALAAVVPLLGIVPPGATVRGLVPPAPMSTVFALARLGRRNGSGSSGSRLQVWGSTSTSSSNNISSSSVGPWRRGLRDWLAAPVALTLQQPAQSVPALQHLAAVVQLNAAPAAASSALLGQVLRTDMQSSTLSGSFSMQDFGKKAFTARPAAVATVFDARQLRANSLTPSLKVGTMICQSVYVMPHMIAVKCIVHLILHINCCAYVESVVLLFMLCSSVLTHDVYTCASPLYTVLCHSRSLTSCQALSCTLSSA
jgi:hypothetical protein